MPEGRGSLLEGLRLPCGPADTSAVASRRPAVILLGFGIAHDALAGRLLLLGIRPLRADKVESAIRLLQRQDAPPRAAILPADPPFRPLKEALAPLVAAAPALRLLALGERPGLEAAEALRRAGVRHCLWDPCTDSELRFVLNRILYDSRRGQERTELRVPTGLMARIRSAAGEKPALVYNLSVGGAYLETPRPTGVGGHVQVTLPLPEGHVELRGQVISTNVPGNLQRPNLPVGMGVRFEELGEREREIVARYVRSRARSFDL